MRSRIRKPIPSSGYHPFQKNSPVGLGASLQISEFEEGMVIDVITNNEHPNYATDGYNVGSIQFRFLQSGQFQPEDQLSWAFPLQSAISEYPFKGELVYIVRSLNRFWYIAKFNISNRVTAQDISELITETKPSITSSTRTQQMRESQSKPYKSGPNSQKRELGDYFQEDTSIFRLKHVEGDILFEGRGGQSIRMGTSWLNGSTGNISTIPFKSSKSNQSPNLLMRIGPDPNATSSVSGMFGLVVEDINKDASSIWMVSDQIVPLAFSTQPSGNTASTVQGVSVSDFPQQLAGNQIIVNTDRIIINAKSDKILGNSVNGIHWTTLKDFTIDADGNHITWTTLDRSDRVVQGWKQTVGNTIDISAGQNINHIAGQDYNISANNINVIGKKIHVGGVSESEPLVLGSTLVTFLDQLLTILELEPLIITTGMPGSPSPQNPARITQLTALKTQYIEGGVRAAILSLDNFTVKNNDTPNSSRKISPYTEE